MLEIYHQLQGLYIAGDVLCAVDCVRALPDYRHTVFVNTRDGYDEQVASMLRGLGADIRQTAIVTEREQTPALRAVFYHCVGHDEQRSGEYVRFRTEPAGVKLCAWIHTPGLCGGWSERYNFLRDRGCSCLIFDSSFSLHNTPGIDPGSFAVCAIINPSIDADHYASVQRIEDGVFRVGRWSRGNDSKYSDDFLELLAQIEIPAAEYICMGIPGKFRNRPLPPRVRLVDNGAIALESLVGSLDVLLYKTDAASWHEGWCRTVTEAMAAGIVPVVENRGGIVDQVIHGYNGFLCNDNAAFKYYAELLYHDPAERARLSANARSFATRNFGLANLRAALQQILTPAPARRLHIDIAGIHRDDLDDNPRPLPGAVISASVDPFLPRLPFDDDEFDEIVAFHVLEQVADKTAIIEEIMRVARHNAVIRITLADRHDPATADQSHRSFWELDDIDGFVHGASRSAFVPTRAGVLRKYTTGREIRWELLAIRRFPAAIS